MLLYSPLICQPALNSCLTTKPSPFCCFCCCCGGGLTTCSGWGCCCCGADCCCFPGFSFPLILLYSPLICQPALNSCWTMIWFVFPCFKFVSFPCFKFQSINCPVSCCCFPLFGSGTIPNAGFCCCCFPSPFKGPFLSPPFANTYHSTSVLSTTIFFVPPFPPPPAWSIFSPFCPPPPAPPSISCGGGALL